MSILSRALDGTNSPRLVCSISLFGPQLSKDQNCHSHAGLASGSGVDELLAIMVVTILTFSQLSWSLHGHFGMSVATGFFV